METREQGLNPEALNPAPTSDCPAEVNPAENNTTGVCAEADPVGDLAAAADAAAADAPETPAPAEGAEKAAREAADDADARLVAESAEAEEKADACPTDTAGVCAETDPAGDLAAAAEEARPEPKSKEEVLAMLTELAGKDGAEISREEVARMKQRFYAFRKNETDAELQAWLAEGHAAEEFKPALDESEETFKELLNTIKDKKAEQTAREEAERRENLEKKQALIAELRTISTDTDNVNRAFPRVKEIQTEFKALGEVPAPNATEIWKDYQGAVEQFYDQLKINKDLRDYDFKKNLELKTLLCEEAEKLADEADIILAFKRLQNLHDEWRQTGPVAKDIREEIWMRFKEASAVINKKYQAFFEERKAREAENEAAKTAICERLEALDFSTLNSYSAWDQMTATVLEAQAEWKGLGFTSRKSNNLLFNRFRAVCDKFFAAKADYYRAVKDELARNLEKKIALCEKAEALSGSTDWRATADALVALQKEWKGIGAVAKKHSDTVWRRFQKACDTFFENRKKNLNDGRAEQHANLQAKRQVIADLKAIPLDANRAEMMPKVKELQAKWQEIGHVPFRDKDKIYDEYRAVCDTIYNTLGMRGGDRGRSRFEDVIKEMGSDHQQLYRERERIMRQCEIKRNELKTYENNLGFLSSKSKSGDSMVREMERRIQKIKDDLAATEAKIKLIDDKLR